MKYDIFGIGSALIDLLVEIDDNELLELRLRKGQFHLIGEEDLKKLLKKIEKHRIKISPGGSSANTLYGTTLLGSSVVFCGKIGKDPNGDMYEKKMFESGVRPRLSRSEEVTGQAITFITPDSERTFATYLGAALHLKKTDIPLEDLRDSKTLHIEGYQLEDKQLREVSVHAMQFAREHDVVISIDLGDPGVVIRNRETIKEIIREYADIVFANEEEATGLIGLKPSEALNCIAKLSRIAIMKIGKYGSYIQQGNAVYKIPAYEAKTVDTTGAGDMFAAGFLYGICSNHNLRICGHIGSYFAAKVVENIGARLEYVDQKKVQELIEKNKMSMAEKSSLSPFLLLSMKYEQ